MYARWRIGFIRPPHYPRDHMNASRPAQRIGMHEGLTRRERTVLSWLRKGLSNKDIALAIGISPRTVQKHLQRVYQHLGVRTRMEALVQTQTGVRKRRSGCE